MFFNLHQYILSSKALLFVLRLLLSSQKSGFFDLKLFIIILKKQVRVQKEELLRRKYFDIVSWFLYFKSLPFLFSFPCLTKQYQEYQ